MVERKKVSISDNMKQRGSGKEIPRAEATVYDFMPVILGDQFRTNPVLLMQLFRDAPVRGPMMLMQRAYTALGEQYVRDGKLTPALECYKFALYEQTGFIGFISGIQGSALLTPQEISHLNLESDFEETLIGKVANNGETINSCLHYSWLDLLRAAHKLEGEYNRDEGERWKRPNLELQLSMGRFGNDGGEGVEFHAEQLGDENLIKRVKLARPREILDVRWLIEYVGINHPESSMFRGS